MGQDESTDRYHISEKKLVRIRGEFERLDLDGDGFLSKKEVEAGLKQALPKLNAIRIRQMVDQTFERYDTHPRDGKLSYEEFLASKIDMM